MLGENHSLLCEFPKLSEKIQLLNETNESFRTKAAQYDALDEEIRNLELNNSPAGDQTMHEIKQQRARLKDELYQQLTKA